MKSREKLKITTTKRKTSRGRGTAFGAGVNLDLTRFVRQVMGGAPGEGSECAGKPCGIVIVRIYAVKITDIDFDSLSPLGCLFITKDAFEKELRKLIEKGNIYNNTLCGKGCECHRMGKLGPVELKIPPKRLAVYLSRTGDPKTRADADCEVQFTFSAKVRTEITFGTCEDKPS
jgi:hypothetical protein